uniref:(northern house mosquito) hypothetical protein n=1 Tax=Culex pipiens TaxID=7175 RepID=A0A8D8FI24_CULPI
MSLYFRFPFLFARERRKIHRRYSFFSDQIYPLSEPSPPRFMVFFPDRKEELFPFLNQFLLFVFPPPSPPLLSIEPSYPSQRFTSRRSFFHLPDTFFLRIVPRLFPRFHSLLLLFFSCVGRFLFFFSKRS